MTDVHSHDIIDDERTISPLAILFSVLTIIFVVLILWWLVRLYQSRTQPIDATTTTAVSPVPSASPSSATPPTTVEAPLADVTAGRQNTPPVRDTRAAFTPPTTVYPPTTVTPPTSPTPLATTRSVPVTAAPASVRPPRTVSTGPGSDVGYSRPVSVSAEFRGGSVPL